MILLILLIVLVAFIFSKVMVEGILFGVALVIFLFYKMVTANNYNKRLFFKYCKWTGMFVGGVIGLMVIAAFIRAYIK